MKALTINEIKALYPNEWVLLSVENSEHLARCDRGVVLLHGKDYLELCYKASEIAKDILTTILFTGAPAQNCKWLKTIRLPETPKTT